MLDVRGSDQLQAVVLGLKVVERDVAKDINRATVATMGPVWKSLIGASVMTRQDRAVLMPGARIAGGNPPAALAAGGTRRLAGGGTPAQLSRPVEFGAAQRNQRTTYTAHSTRGRSFQVTRRTRRGLPTHHPRGRVVYPAFGEIGPRLVALWVQLVVRKVYDGIGKGGA